MAPRRGVAYSITLALGSRIEIVDASGSGEKSALALRSSSSLPDFRTER